MKAYPTSSKGAIIAGRILFVLAVLFLLVDALMKVAQAEVSVKGSTDLGWPAEQVQTIGLLLTIFTILYMIPRTAILGAVLITAYLGGAVAVMLRAGQFNPFPIVFGIVVWGALYLLDARVRSVIPLRKAE